MALMSGKVYSNTGAPSNADGVDGDIYLRLDGMKTTYRKESGAWVAVGSTLGAIPEIISGVGAPSNALGADEQYYRDTSNQNIYYKQGSMWNLVGNLTGASFGAVLDQAGVGKDLATAPNLINSGSLNSITTVGEYYYTNAVTDTPSPWGLMKVWREGGTHIYQIVHSSDNRLFHRYTGDGGTTWTTWKTYANPNGDPAEDFNVVGGTNSTSATNYNQVTGLITTALSSLLNPLSLGRFKNLPASSIQYFNSYNLNTVTRTGTGWTVTFINDLPSADYIVVGNVSGGGGYGGRSFEPKNQTTSGFDIDSEWGGDNTAGYSTDDGAEVNFVVF